jgi:hypothetical protein
MLSMIINLRAGAGEELSRLLSGFGLDCCLGGGGIIGLGVGGIVGRMESTMTASGIVPPVEHRQELPVSFSIS